MKRTVALHEPFHDRARQREADRLGMVVFLGTEMMLFGGLFLAIFVLRTLHATEVAAAERRLDFWIGGLNTLVLLTSSVAVAVAAAAARARRPRLAALCLAAAALLGLGFLGIKAWEYLTEYREGLMPGLGVFHDFASPPAQLFMNLYYAATGLHALHLFIGIGAVSTAAVLLYRGGLEPETVENVGLYWHLVDIVWVFLYPALYLLRG